MNSPYQDPQVISQEKEASRRIDEMHIKLGGFKAEANLRVKRIQGNIVATKRSLKSAEQRVRSMVLEGLKKMEQADAAIIGPQEMR